MESSDRPPVVKTGDIVEGRYRIIKTLDEGSMGTVFLAEHVLIKRKVAIKILRPELAADGDLLDRFMNEARAAGTLGHPNIVECTDMGFTRNEVPFIVLEYLEGTLLTDEIYRLGGLPVRRALRIADQIASALYAAHNAGIVHRDLKSDNVFLTDKEDVIDIVKVLDFGISRFLEVDDEKTRRGMMMGTPQFMAPEQITSPASVDKRADIYALGVILYEMLTARRPFADDDEAALLRRVVHDQPPPLMRSDAPPGLEQMILTKLLAKDPAQRYSSMKDVQGALEAFHGVTKPRGPNSDVIQAIRRDVPAQPAAPVVPPLAATTPPEAVVLPVLRKRRSSMPWLIAAVLAGAAGGALMYVEQPATASSDSSSKAKFDGDAEKLASLLEDEVHAAHLRADSIAQTPMLRAAIETDAATVRDMLHGDLSLAAKPGETLEIFQLRDGGAMASMARIPDGAAAIPPTGGAQTRIESDGTALTVTASAPIAKQQTGIGGAIAVAQVVDLTSVKKRIADRAIGATLVGLGKPIVLVGYGTATGPTLNVPVPLAGDLKAPSATLAVITPAPALADTSKLRVARFACWGLGGALLVLYLISLLRGRVQG